MTQPPNNYSMAPKTNQLALTSLILGIAAFPVTCIPFLHYLSWIAAIVAIVLGFIARSQIAAGNGTGSGMAMAGIILGIVYLLLLLVMVLLAVAFGVTFLHFMKKAAEEQQRNQSGGATQLFRHAIDMAFTFGRAWLAR